MAPPFLPYGRQTIEDDDIYGLIELLVVNLAHQPDAWHYRWLARLRRLYRRVAQFNPAERARRNVAHHYDLSGALYDLFLDADRQYSCAYFRRPEDGLEVAQENKKALIAAKLLLEPGHLVAQAAPPGDYGLDELVYALGRQRPSGERLLGVGPQYLR